MLTTNGRMRTAIARGSACLAVAAVVACAGPSPAPAAPSPTGTTATPASTPTVEPAPAETLPPPAAAVPSIRLEPLVERLVDPIGMAAALDNSGRLFVHERGGRVRVIAADGTLVAEPFVDLSDRVRAGGERGLLGLAVHPGFAQNGRVFVHYSRRDDGATVLSELTAGPERTSADPATERVLLTAAQPFANHNGGQVAFGPDGMLYLALGDGGAGGDPHGNGQDPGTLLGTLLRIDVDAAPGGAPYAIPADNPFASGGGAAEVWIYGLRNPWRFSFDRATDELWIADVGENAWEEINRLPAGESGHNMGWNWMEAGHCFRDGCDPAAFTPPLAEYGHDLGCSVTGGYVSRFDASDSTWGWYIFGDYCSGRIFGVRSDAEPRRGEVLRPEILLESGRRISAFGQGEDGRLYLLDMEAGTLHRISGG